MNFSDGLIFEPRTSRMVEVNEMGWSSRGALEIRRESLLSANKLDLSRKGQHRQVMQKVMFEALCLSVILYLIPRLISDPCLPEALSSEQHLFKQENQHCGFSCSKEQLLVFFLPLH